MEDIPENILRPLFIAANSSTLDKSLETLIELAKTSDGRSDLASKNIITTSLHLCKLLSYPSHGDTLLLSLKLMRNLCAGELQNQNSLIEHNGVDIVSNIITSKEIVNDLNYGIIRMGMQVMANVSLAGDEEHQIVIWNRVCSLEFTEIAKLRKQEICDPLCMIIYACIEKNQELLHQLCLDHSLHLLVEIIRTASAVGFGENWLKLILSRTCIEESYFTPIFSKLLAENNDDSLPIFTQDQSFLLKILSEMLNEQTQHVTISKKFISDVFKILKNNLRILNYNSRPKSGLPTGCTNINVIGYSLCILRDVCAFDGLDQRLIIDNLLSLGLIELLLDLLRDLEPPAIIRKTINRVENQDSITYLGKVCPYKGFRCDIVAVIGNCGYKRKNVQDEIREKNGILLMLQQCVTDDENPFLREWGIWGVRNLLDGNLENQRVVRELEVQGSVDLPELSEIGLRVDVDQRTRRAKLVNISG